MQFPEYDRQASVAGQNFSVPHFRSANPSAFLLRRRVSRCFALRMAVSVSGMTRSHRVLVSSAHAQTRYQQKYQQIVRLAAIMAEQT
jgi:hypothetical protein